MKKITYALLGLLLIGSTCFAQQQKGLMNSQITQEKNTEMRVFKPAQKGVGHVNSTKSVVWSNNFSTPADWIMNHTAGATGDWVISADMASWDDNLVSTSGGNFAWFDSDFQGSGTTNEAFMTYASTINCTGHANVQLIFNQYYTRYITTYNETVVQVSNNGTTWVDYPVNSALALNASTTNPNAVYVNITATAANQATVYLRFKYKSAWGYSWQIDDLSIEDVINNDLAAQKSFVDMNGWDYFMVVPVKQLDTIYCGGAVKNLGLNSQTNVTMNVNVNGGTYNVTSSTLPSLATNVTDTLWTRYIPTETTPTDYTLAYNFTQTEVDDNLLNNKGDTMYMYSDASEYWRTMSTTSLMNSYSFGTGAPAASGMEYGATYHFKAIDRIDSITVPVYKVIGTPSIQGKLYTINQTTNAKTLVASTAVVAQPVMAFTGAASFKTLAFTTPYIVAANEYLSATIAITGTMGTDTLSIGSDGGFTGNTAIAGAAYLKVGTTWGWYTYSGVPVVGLKTRASSTATDILTFNLTTPAVTGVVDPIAHTVALTVPFGTDLTALVPTFTLSPLATAKVGAVAQISGTTANNFTAPVTYTVTAEDGTTTQAWIVTVSTTPASLAKDILTYAIPVQVGTSTIDAVAHTVAVAVPFGTDVTALVSTFTLSPLASAKVGAVAQVSGTTANDFTAAVTYTVTAQDATTQAWTVTISLVAGSPLKEILTYSIPTQVGTSTIDAVAHTVAVSVPFGTDVTALVSTFTLSSNASAKVGAVSQVSGTTANNFTAPVVYTVTAQDATTQDWTVTVSIVAGSPLKEILTYSIPTQLGTSTIDPVAYTVAVSVPFGTDVTALVSTFTLSPLASAKVGAVAQVSGTTANNFTAPIVYTVTAQDATTQDWTVTVSVAAVQTYTVTYNVVGTNGSLAATVDAVAVTSPATVETGKNVVFTATPAATYEVKEWKLNGTVVTANTTNTYTLSNVLAAATVTVEFKLSVGVDEATANVVSIYPNPANTVVNVKMNTTISKIEVVNINGQVVTESVLNSNEGSINVSSLANGMYFLRIQTENGITMNKIQIVK